MTGPGLNQDGLPSVVVHAFLHLQALPEFVCWPPNSPPETSTFLLLWKWITSLLQCWMPLSSLVSPAAAPRLQLRQHLVDAIVGSPMWPSSSPRSPPSMLRVLQRLHAAVSSGDGAALRAPRSWSNLSMSFFVILAHRGLYVPSSCSWACTSGSAVLVVAAFIVPSDHKGYSQVAQHDSHDLCRFAILDVPSRWRRQLHVVRAIWYV